MAKSNVAAHGAFPPRRRRAVGDERRRHGSEPGRDQGQQAMPDDLHGVLVDGDRRGVLVGDHDVSVPDGETEPVLLQAEAQAVPHGDGVDVDLHRRVEAALGVLQAHRVNINRDAGEVGRRWSRCGCT